MLTSSSSTASQEQFLPGHNVRAYFEGEVEEKWWNGKISRVLGNGNSYVVKWSDGTFSSPPLSRSKIVALSNQYSRWNATTHVVTPAKPERPKTKSNNVKKRAQSYSSSDSEESDEDAAVIRSLQLKTAYLENEVKRLNKVVKRLKRTQTLDQNTTLKEMVDMANRGS